MLNTIDDQGNITWDCHNPICRYHHCAGWDDHCVCPHHTQKIEGTPLTAHISHDAIVYTGADIVALPPCPGCGSQTFVKVQFDDAHLLPPVIERDEHGRITSVTVKGAPNFTVIKDHTERLLIQIDDLRALPDGTKLIWKDGMAYREMTTYVVDDAYMAPVVQRHQALHEQLQAIGKKFKEKDGT